MTRHEIIADLLMGAAYADKQLDGRELDKVKSLLCELMRVKKLPGGIEQRLAKFNAKKFDVLKACDKLMLASDEEKRRLIELIAAVHESDDTWDFDEDAYLRKVAAALRVPEEHWRHLTVELLSIETIRESLLPD